MTKSEAGQLGGLSTLRKHGKLHMSKIGAAGAKATWERHVLKPYGTRQWAMVSRETNKVIAIIRF